MFTTDAVIIGAGQAGLAVSRCLTDAGVDHVVLERARIAERWRSERWDALRLLSPNWATRLPRWTYSGSDPNGYMTAREFADYLDNYAASFAAPVRTTTTVTSVERTGGRFTVRTDRGSWRARSVVIATGWCDRARVPAAAHDLSPAIMQLTPQTYRNPSQLLQGGVLIVGASASGVQLADELARAGREVTLSVGRHSRVPRRYRGKDIWWWLEQIGVFAVTIDEVADPGAARKEGAMQLMGRADPDVDLPTLRTLGVRLTGRMRGIDGTHVGFEDDLATNVANADARMCQILMRIDAHIARHGLSQPDADPRPSAIAGEAIQREVDLRRAGITTVLWATGYTRRYPWLHVPALGRDGEIRQRRGVAPVAGLYVLGQRFQHRRDSNFIDGVRHDAATVAWHIADACRADRVAAC